MVRKYGGKCLATLADVQRVAKDVTSLYQKDRAVIVVVSAMGQTTDELTRLAYQISSRPARRELDMLLTTGERVSMALMSMALQDLGCPAVSFTGSQAGVLTDDSHSNARITDLRPIRIEQSLTEGKVVVLAGFQGVSPRRKEVTTLGRGGSDTTAVAMAAHFKAERCEILKDVSGVFSADPKLIPQAHHYSELSYDQVARMCFWGAKVLHYRSVELAQAQGVPLFVGSATLPERGTLITQGVPMFEQAKILAINSHPKVHHYQVAGQGMAQSFEQLDKALRKMELPWPQILASVHDPSGWTRFMVTGDDWSLASLEALAQQKNEWGLSSLNQVMASVTLSGYGLSCSPVLNQALELLKAVDVAVEKVITHEGSLSFFVSPTDLSKAMSQLHLLIESSAL